MSSSAVLRCAGLGKTFDDGTLCVDVLNGIDLTIEPGETVAIVGASGSGKSTLLHLLGGLDLPTTGEVWITGARFDRLSDKQRGDIRNRKLGFIYQFHHLLPEFTLLENVAMPLWVRGLEKQEALEISYATLASIGMDNRAEHRPGELSGGERQRGAIARALVTQPACILADEPTGNLDSGTAGVVFDEMLKLNVSNNTALVMVTHDENMANKLDRVFRLKGGVLV
jgi:lipoprotein-releasing system ATP-binding protein